MFFETPDDEIKCLRQLQEIDDQDPMVYHDLGYIYVVSLFQYDKAIPEFEKALEIYNKWGSKPMWEYNYTILGYAYHKTGQYKKERKLYIKAEQDFPDSRILIQRQAILALTERDTITANRYIKKYLFILKENSASETVIATGLSAIYYRAGDFDNAEKYCRQILSLNPESPDCMNTLGYLLIETNRNVNEGLELLDKALALSPDNYEFMETKGWGLYKLDKYKEALEILQKSWEKRLKNAVYDHGAFLHLEAAKKAVANQKKN
jgi:tetratricopeptide (TPR) repeat protein